MFILQRKESGSSLVAFLIAISIGFIVAAGAAKIYNLSRKVQKRQSTNIQLLGLRDRIISTLDCKQTVSQPSLKCTKAGSMVSAP